MGRSTGMWASADADEGDQAWRNPPSTEVTMEEEGVPTERERGGGGQRERERQTDREKEKVGVCVWGLAYLTDWRQCSRK
jgi:hypothetical protein